MELLIFAIFVVVAVAQRSSKKKEENNTRRQSRAAFEQAEQLEMPMEGNWPAGEDANSRERDIDRQRRLKARLMHKHGDKLAGAEAESRQGEPGWEGRSRTTAAVTGAYSDEYLGSMLYDSSEGEGRTTGEYRREELSPQSDDHVVRAFTESRHSHTESSITGFNDCHESDVYDISRPVEDKGSAALPMLNQSTVRSAILYSEILGKPKALRGMGR